MARIPRIKISDVPTIYHVISRTALEGYPLDDAEKEHFVSLIKHFSQIYFTEIIGYAVLGNHWHLLLRMHPENTFSDEDITRRFQKCYGEKRVLMEAQIPFYRHKWANLSEFVKDIKQNFSRFFNKRHNRKGFFWGDRFKSLIVEKGEALISCLAYIDLNPVRAGIVGTPEEYRWSSIGYHAQTQNKDDFLSLDYGLQEFVDKDKFEILRLYRKFLYETGAVRTEKGPGINALKLKKERGKNYQLSRTDRFSKKTRYFTDSCIIGSRDFVHQTYQTFKHYFQSKDDRKPNAVKGLSGIYTLKRLKE